MTHSKKKSAAWLIALHHWLQAGFMIPLLLGIAFDLSWQISLDGNFLMKSIASLAVYPLITSIGVLYSTRVIRHVYTEYNPLEIARLSFLYIIIVSGGIRIYGLFFYHYEIDGLIEMIAWIIRAITFYVLSLKLLSN